MKYLLMRKADADTERGVMPSEELLQAMADYNERLLQAGVLVTGEGLRPSSEGFRVAFNQGEPTVTKGPFENAEELLAGYTMIDVSSEEDAIQWATQWPKQDAMGHACIELRRCFELEDFAPGPALDKHRDLYEGLSRLPKRISIYLGFNGNCREAMTFYAEVLGGRIEAMLTYADTPEAGAVGPECQDKVAHACLNLGGTLLMGGDAIAGTCTELQGSAVHLEYTDPGEAERVFNQFAEGGSVQMPFAETFWAHRFGMVRDRFGSSWMLSCENAPGQI